MASKSSVPEAAVLLALLNDGREDRVLLTQRSHTLREHPGEVAFPGGRREQDDNDLYHTALRECHEEVGIDAVHFEFVMGLSEHRTRAGAKVSPYVARLASAPELTLNKHEIAAAFWVPLSLFAEDKRSYTHVFQTSSGEYWAPVYHYEGYEIWGFTARVLVTFVNSYMGGNIRRAHQTAPEQLFAP